MDSEVIYSVFGIVVLVFIIIMVFRSKEVVVTRSQQDKKADVVSSYKQRLQEALRDLDGDERVEKKTSILKQFSHELALNIYFDESDIRELIVELSKE